MSHSSKRAGAMILRLFVGLALLGWPRVGSAQGTWSVISLPPKPGEVVQPVAASVDAAGNLYVLDAGGIRRRGVSGNWSVIATYGEAVGQVSGPTALAVDAAGNLYVADGYYDFLPTQSRARIQKRDAQGNWSVLATVGLALGQVYRPSAVAADTAGNLYVADSLDGRVQKRDAQGNWSVIATIQVNYPPGRYPSGLAVDNAGNLYVAEASNLSGVDPQIQKRDAQGNWSVIAIAGSDLGQGNNPTALAADGEGNLYVADGGYSDYQYGIQKRNAQGNWFVIATHGADLGQVPSTSALAVDAAGNLYVADLGANDGRIQRRDARGSWSVIATDGWEPGQISSPSSIAADAAGNLYVADGGEPNFRLQKRDAQGHWSVTATYDGFYSPSSLAADSGGNLYAADVPEAPGGYAAVGLIEKRDVQGHWSVLATVAPLKRWHDFDYQYKPRPVYLAADAGGNLYVADWVDYKGSYAGIQKRDTQGNWAEIDATGSALGQVGRLSAVAVDGAGNLYVADQGDDGGLIEKRDAQGNWSVIADFIGPLAVDSSGNLYVGGDVGIQKRDAQGNWSAIDGPYGYASSLAVDGAGNLYVADTDNNRVLKYTPAP